MEIKQMAMVGSLESSDLMVEVSPGSGGILIELESSVELLYGESIRQSILEVAREMGITHAQVKAVDRGALDCTVRARAEAAFLRAAGGGINA